MQYNVLTISIFIMLKAILRQYKKGQDTEERWKCPNCGKKQAYYPLDPDNDTMIGTCCNCGEKIQLIYKRFRGKNF